MPVDRVLATQQARDAAKQLRALTGPVKEQVGRVLQHGRVLADPTQWDGGLAVRWRNGWGSDANQLKQTAARLDELERRAHEVVEDIFKADSGSASGGEGPGLPDLETYDRFDKTLAFIHQEMIVNVQADFIKKLAAERKQIWWKGGLAALPGIPGIPGKIIAGKAAIDAGKAAKEFYDHVKTGGPWDHKPRLRKDLGLDETQDYYFPIRGNEKYELYYDLWSNIHYGYVGKAAGFPRDILQAGAGNEPGAGRNDQADVISVDIGVQLWTKHGTDLKPEDIHRAILDHIDDYEQAMKEDPELRFLKPWDNGR